MAINREALNDCMHYISNTQIEELFTLMFGKDVDEEFANKIANMILESILVKRLAEVHYKKIEAKYGLIGNLKRKKDITDKTKKIRSSIEKTFSKGIEEFLHVFEDKFEEHELLLKKMRKPFKNYKFKDINIVNDYSILFFAFKLFDYYVEDFEGDMLNEEAEKLVKLAYESLKKPYHKKQMTVTSDSLIAFVKKTPYEDYKHVYVDVLIKFIQALYVSLVLPDWIRYLFFERFEKHLIFINIFLDNSINNTESKTKIKDSFEKREKIQKSVSNKKQELKKLEESDEVINDISELQRYTRKFPKNSEDLRKMSKKSISTYCRNVFHLLDKLDRKSSGELGSKIKSILSTYGKMPLDIDGKDVSAFRYILSKVCLDSVNKCIKTIPNMLDGNTYLSLIFSLQLFDDELFKQGSDPVVINENMRKVDEISDFRDAIIKDIQNYVYNKIPMYVDDNNAKAYEDIVQYVDFNSISMPILCIKDNSEYFYYINEVVERLC